MQREIRVKDGDQTTVEAKVANSLSMKFAYIPLGSFLMGCGISAEETARQYGGEASLFDGEHPRHRVTLTRRFFSRSQALPYAPEIH